MLSHASRSSRHAFLISAAVALLVGGLARTATAKTCTTDLDCDTGYRCAIQAYAPTGGATSVGSGAATGSLDNGTGGAGGSVASAGGVVGSSCPKGSNCVEVPPPPTELPMPVDAGFAFTPDAGVLPPEPVPTPVTGICEPKPIICTTAADCPSTDFDCVPSMVPAIACPENTMCPDLSYTTGICVAKLHACSTAADCPAPLDCQAQYTTCSGGGAVAPDGTVTKMPETCTPGPSVCFWNPVTCTIDTGCADPLYQCVKVGESGWCSGSGQACAVGAICPPPPPPTCGTTAIMNCMPKLIDCGAGQACPTGWTCLDLSNLGGVPSTWGSIASNNSCLPDGIILAAQGYAAGGIPFGAASGTTAGGTSGTGPIGIGETNPTSTCAANQSSDGA